MNAKRIYRLYGLEGLAVRMTPRKRLASRARIPLPQASRPNERWSMDFVSARLAAALSLVLRHRRAPQAITVDNGGEFVKPRHGRLGVRA